MPLFIFIIFLSFFIQPSYAGVTRDPGTDFRLHHSENAREWLASKGFIFERDADDLDATHLYFSETLGLVIEAREPTQSIIALKKGHLDNYREILIKWGVNKFPKGASYAKGKRNEAIMFYAFFGTEMIDSGSIFVPDSPYFIALHLCENDKINKPELGRFYHKGGRFICVAQPKIGEIVTTRFDLKEAFYNIYGFRAPPLYGIAFEFDTKGAPDNGKTSGFIQQIHFPAATYYRED